MRSNEGFQLEQSTGIPIIPRSRDSPAFPLPSSRGPGHSPLKASTPVRIRSGAPIKTKTWARHRVVRYSLYANHTAIAGRLFRKRRRGAYRLAPAESPMRSVRRCSGKPLIPVGAAATELESCSMRIISGAAPTRPGQGGPSKLRTWRWRRRSSCAR